NIVIRYEYTDSSGTITLAQASGTLDLSAGDGSILFTDTDFDTTSFDEDGDGFSNAAEFTVGTDPWLVDKPPCVIGTSPIGNCALG
ncbi:MAG: hypothetical protein OQL09_05675, partial [Gammaproteobacteria bacterium]|nr:hypothetical protein [Gammaproteobacteria bacterium]